MTDVFISYSRKDTDFVRRLFDALRAEHCEVWVDWQDINYSTKWWKEICEGIEKADNFLLVITPDSLNSMYCHQEIEHARRFNKRIIPVIHCEIDEKITVGGWYKLDWETLARDNWEHLKTIQHIYFRPSDDFSTRIRELLKTVYTDPEHIQMHTRLLLWMREWERSARNPSYLLRGDDLAQAESWLNASVGKDPRPSDEQRVYLSASRETEDALKEQDVYRERSVRQFRWAAVSLAAVVIVLLIAATVALVAAGNAENQSNVAKTNEAKALAVGATVEWKATFFAVDQERKTTLVAGGVIVPLVDSTQPPADFIATLTRVEKLNTWKPHIEKDSFGVEMVLVPAGCFWMGSVFQPEEQPVNEVCFDKPFWIDRYEVSNGQFEHIRGLAMNSSTWSDPTKPRTDINWFEAQAFCAQRDARLPTEGEWEYAARGPNSTVYPWGNTFVAENVVYRDTGQPAGIGENQRSGGVSWVGAYDMSGNVWEWTGTIYDQDRFLYPYDSADGREEFSTDVSVNRVLRGGGFNDTPLEYPLRAAFRFGQSPYFSYFDLGFRCSRSGISDYLLTSTPTKNPIWTEATLSPAIELTPNPVPISISVIGISNFNDYGCSASVSITIAGDKPLTGQICVTNDYVDDCTYGQTLFFPVGETIFQIALVGKGQHTIRVYTDDYYGTSPINLVCSE